MTHLLDIWRKRGMIEQLTAENLYKRLENPLSAYLGIDPTKDSLQLGNLVGIIACGWLQKWGHTPFILIGEGTAKIGDPSGKNRERPFLDLEELATNSQAVQRQITTLLDRFGGEKKAQFVNNDAWLSSWKLTPFLRDIGKCFRLGPMLGKESVRSRLQSKEGLSFTEFSYQILQAYDFYYLFQEKGILLQIGGKDQWTNITAGVELTRKLTGQEVFGLTHPLLTRSDGSKFGKSEEGAIWLDPQKTSPYQFYQYMVQVTDTEVGALMRMLTFMDIEEIHSLETAITSGHFTPHVAQKRLAEEVTRLVHGQENLDLALRITSALAPGSTPPLEGAILEELMTAMPSISLDAKEVIAHPYVELLVKGKMVGSKGEAVRLIKNGGAYLNNQRVEDPKQTIAQRDLIEKKYLLLSAGKKKKFVVRVVDPNESNRRETLG